MTEYLELLEENDQELVQEALQPGWIDPMLATLTEDYFSDPSWIFERKLDGVRCLIFKNKGQVTIMSRNRKILNESYPEVIPAFENTESDFIADGELVALEGEHTSFSKLQNRMNVQKPAPAIISEYPVYLYLFDLIYLDGHDLRKLPLIKRKKILNGCIDYNDKVRFCDHKHEKGLPFLQQACEEGWEGLIAKRANSIYTAGRSKDWLKFKCMHQQEFVVGGFTKPKGSRTGFGAILVGFYDSGKLMYAGKVGTGFNDQLLEKMHNQLSKIEIKASPFNEPVRQKDVHWTTPEMVVEIGFTEWTSADKLRHPRFIGIRNDKSANEVTKES